MIEYIADLEGDVVTVLVMILQKEIEGCKNFPSTSQLLTKCYLYISSSLAKGHHIISGSPSNNLTYLNYIVADNDSNGLSSLDCTILPTQDSLSYLFFILTGSSSVV